MNKLVVSSVSEVAFGGLKGTHLTGLNHDFVVVFGRNEAGKSTLAEFLAWLLAGPEGDAASARRFGDAGVMVGGRLNGDLEGKPVEINGTFKILDKGAPSDVPNKGQKAPRQGTIGGLNVDSQSLRQRFGLTPQQYALLLRFRAETMHHLNNEDLLLDLFSSYATGSVESSIQPRDVIDMLEKRAKSMTAELKTLTTQHGTAVKAVEEASRLPAEIRDLEKKVAELEAESDALAGRLDSINALVGLVQAAVDSFDKQVELRAAESTLAATPPIPAEWTDIADVLGEAGDAADRVVAVEEEVARVQPIAEELASQVGPSVDVLARHHLGTSDRDHMRDAAKAVLLAEKSIKEVESAHAEVVSEETPVKQRAAEAILACGAPEETVRRHVSSLAEIKSLSAEAGEADNAHTRARQLRRDLEEKIALREAAERDMANESPVGSPVGTRSDASLVLALAVTVCVAVGLSFVHPIAALAAGVLGSAVSGWMYRRSRRNLTAQTPENALSPLAAVVTSRRQDESTAQLLSDSASSTAVNALEALNEKLNGRGFASALPGTAFSHVTSIEKAVTMVAEVVDHANQLAVSDGAVNAARTRVSVARTTYDRLFAQREIDSPPGPADFDDWAETYARALNESARLASASSALESARKELAEYTQSVPSLLAAPNASVVLSRIRETTLAKSSRDSAAGAVARAESDLRIAVGGRQAVMELLQSAHSREELVNHLESHKSDAKVLGDERSALLQEIGALKNDVKQLSGVEEVPVLIEARETLADSISELARETAVVTVALESVRSVVQKFERENQGPVVEIAQAIIDQVDPLFGHLVVEGSGDSRQLRVERSGTRIDVSKLSTGARTVVYLALRLAFLSMDAQNRTVALPLLCDDPVVTLDDERLAPAIALLHAESRNRQVLLFTCHERTVNVARSLGAHIVNL